MNLALRQFYQHHTFPHPAPISTDLIEAFYAVSEPSQHAKINELLKRIVLYDLSIEDAIVSKLNLGTWQLTITANTSKWEEDSKGNTKVVPFEEPIEALISFEDGKKEMVSLKVDHQQKVSTTLTFPQKPILIELDPEGKFLNKRMENTEKKISERK